MRVKIYYHHTDCGGVVYYANYLQFFEEARSEFMEQRGVSLAAMVEKGYFFVVSRQEIDYKAPARYGQILDVSSQVSAISRVRLEFVHEVKNAKGVLICTAKTILAYVNRELKPTVIPQEMIDKINAA